MTLYAAPDQPADGGAALPPQPSLVDDRPVGLPEPRGPLTEWLIDRLARPVHDVGGAPAPSDDPVTGEDTALALYLCYELHYLGLPDVDEAWEWEPSIIALRGHLEQRFERRLVELVGPAPMGLTTAEVVAALRSLASGDDTESSLSQRMAERGTRTQLKELAVHRSAYQLKEADPHTWAIPRLTGRAKAALVDIQFGEYGDGDPARVHATLFARTMAELGLDNRYGALLDEIPATTLSTCNLVTLFGLHRRWRGALVGHLALFEMCSVGPMQRYCECLERLGFGADATEFYRAHVIADARHERVAVDDMVVPLVQDEPYLGGEIVFGARCLAVLEAMMSRHITAAWDRGDSSLRRPRST